MAISKFPFHLFLGRVLMYFLDCFFGESLRKHIKKLSKPAWASKLNLLGLLEIASIVSFVIFYFLVSQEVAGEDFILIRNIGFIVVGLYLTYCYFLGIKHNFHVAYKLSLILFTGLILLCVIAVQVTCNSGFLLLVPAITFLINSMFFANIVKRN